MQRENTPSIPTRILTVRTGKLFLVSERSEGKGTFGWLLALVLVGWQIYVAGPDAVADGGTLIEYGARKPSFGFPQEPWRLAASMFLHGGWIHLVANCILIGLWGNQLSRLVGGTLFFLSFLVTGIWGSLLSDIYGPEALAVGASGGASGLVLMILALALFGAGRSGWDGEAKSWLKISIIAIALNTAMALGLTGGGFGRLDHWAHTGGAVAGLVLGLIASRDNDRSNRWLWVGIGAMGALAGFVIWYRGPNPLA